MAALPNEIIMIILSNLPVNSLLRFKCVSKSWCCWISCPKFELSNQRRQGAIVTVDTYYSTTPSLVRPSFRLVNQQLTLEELNYLSSDDDEISIETCRILGSCHGLILFNLNEHIYLWNPATRFRTKVLELDYLLRDYTIRGGLCYDSSNNAYKVVLIVMRYYSTPPGAGFMIIASLDQDERWRQLEFPYDIGSVTYGITLHGRLHYWVRDKNPHRYENDGEDDDENIGEDDVINELHKGTLEQLYSEPPKLIYFDSVSEKFHMFPVPEPKSNQQKNIIVGLGVLNECLCMSRLDDDDEGGGVEILVMKEYGIKESWTSLFFIRNLEINPSFRFVAPFCVTETGEIALITDSYDKDVVVYNPKNDNMRDIPVFEKETEFVFGHMVTYVESLIWPQEFRYYSSEELHKLFGNNRFFLLNDRDDD